MYSLISNIKSTYILYISALIGDQNLKKLTILFVIFHMDRYFKKDKFYFLKTKITTKKNVINVKNTKNSNDNEYFLKVVSTLSRKLSDKLL